MPKSHALSGFCRINLLTLRLPKVATVGGLDVAGKAQLPADHFRLGRIPLVVADRTPSAVVEDFDVAWNWEEFY